MLLPRPAPLHIRHYHLARYIAWLGFDIHVISRGMTALASQIITVVVLLLSTALLIFRVFAVEDRIGSKMRIRRLDERGECGSYGRAYSRSKLIEDEEESLVVWNLGPLQISMDWWKKTQSWAGVIRRYAATYLHY